jgi:hypothetical protein
MKRAAELIAEGGLPDGAIAAQLGLTGHAGRMVVSRHRRFHVEAPAKAIAEAANKGRAIVEQREKTLAAVEHGDVAAAWIALPAIVEDLRAVHLRLEESADRATAGGQLTAGATIAGQQIRLGETRARLGGLRGFTPPAAAPSSSPVFNLTIAFADGRTEMIATTSPVADMIPEALPEALLDDDSLAGGSCSGEVVEADDDIPEDDEV